MKLRRIVVKVGSSSVSDESGRLSQDHMAHIVNCITDAVASEGIQVVLVTSGAVAAGKGRLGWNRSNHTIPEKQAAAAVGQGLLIDTYQRLFFERGVYIGQLLLTRSDIEHRHRFTHIRNTIETLLRHGVVPIVNENDTVAVDEIRFGDNDTLASLVALVAEADVLLILTDIDGLYNANPRTDPSAERITDVWMIDETIEHLAGGAGSPVGTGGMKTKISAAKIATDSGVEVVIAHSKEADVIMKLVRGETIGTRFHAHADHLTGKRSWMAHGSRAQGRIVVDQGAAKALLLQSGSLLLPGILAVSGEFSEGATVELVDDGGVSLGRGSSNFSAWDLHLLLERKRNGEKLHALQEVVHRNHMALWKERNRT